MNANTTPTPVCEECDFEMHRYGGMDGDSYVEGWGCDGCGWSEDDDYYQELNREPVVVPTYAQKQKELFEYWKKLGCMVSDMGAIIQNDIRKYPVTKEDIHEYENRLYNLQKEIYEHSTTVRLFLYKELEI